MQLFTLQSKQEQIAEILKKQIVSGKVATGTKLSSVRNLANDFKVSTKVVIGALNLLEQEQLIIREQGRGIFVQSYSANRNLEVCMMAWNINTKEDVKDNIYFSSLTRISYPPYLQDGFNFTVRTVPFSRDATTAHFTRELERLNKMYHADCLLIVAPSLNQSKIKACLNLDTPVLFIGDFSHGPDPDIMFNQVTGDNKVYGNNCVRKLVELENFTDLIIYTTSLEHYFCNMLYQGVTETARELNIKIHLVEMQKGFSQLDRKKQYEVLAQKSAEAGISSLRNALSLNGGVSDVVLHENIKRGNIPDKIYKHINSAAYMRQLYNTIFNEIRRIAKSPEKTRKIVLQEKFEGFTMIKMQPPG